MGISIAGFLLRCFVCLLLAGVFCLLGRGQIICMFFFLLSFLHLISFIICIGLGVCLFGWLQGGREAWEEEGYHRLFVS
jgi:hypothetical protein